jgi:alpha-L-fucosidase 2
MRPMPYLLLLTLAAATSRGEAPYPAALERAAVAVATLAEPIHDAIILGNGDLNALVFAEGEDLVVRITKNDVWDARLETTLDPPLPTLARLKELGSGPWPDRNWILPEGVAPPETDSYHANAYPCPRICGVLRIAGAARPPLVGKLDLGRAELVLHSASASLRVWIPADANAVIAESLDERGLDARLEAVRSDDIPAPEEGVLESRPWIAQRIPGDLDWPGMQFALALEKRERERTREQDSDGERERTREQGSALAAVGVATSTEASDPRARALGFAAAAAREDGREAHETTWRAFWGRSGIALDDPVLERVWYRSLYFLRCVARPGVVSVGLFAGLLDDKPAWHGDYHTNYNLQQTYWAAYSANHDELTEPYDRLIAGYLPRARWLARTIFDMDGAYIPHVLYAYEPADPESCAMPNGRQYIHHVWGFSLSVAGFSVQPLWWHYLYAPERGFLEQVAYPAVRDVADFQADFIEQCERDGDRVVLAPTVSPEHWGWTEGFERNRNCTFDIAMFHYIFNAAREGAARLGVDEAKVARWRAAAALLPEYPVWSEDPQVVVDVQGAPPIVYNIPVPTSPVFPCDVVTFQSPESERALFANTLEQLKHNGNNAPVMLAVARARLSTPDAWDFLHTELIRRERRNGTLSFNRLVPPHRFNPFGHYTEMFGAALPVTELLLQSVGGIIRVFPAWPLNIPAEFTTLRAEGGFLVSAAVRNGGIGEVRIESTAGGPLRILAPWPKTAVERNALVVTVEPFSDNILVLDTAPGDHLLLRAE